MRIFSRFFFLIPLLIFTIVYSLYFNNLSWGDEYDNMVYSWLVKDGLVPYRDFFTHHFPSLIFLGVPLEFLSHSKDVYRGFVFLIYILFFSFFSYYLKGVWGLSVLVFALLSSFGIALFGGQQFVDGTFWGIFLLSGFFIIVKKQGEILEFWEILLFSLLVVFTAFSSPAHLLGFAMLIGYHLYLQKKSQISFSKNFSNFKVFFLIILSAFVLFLIYLFLTKAFSDFVYDAFTFNEEIYFYRSGHDITGIKFIDFYLWTSREFLVHVYLLLENEGTSLLTFIKASKFLILPFGLEGNYSNYLSTIWRDLYNNFFSFEMFILLFYLLGVIALFSTNKAHLAIFCLVFIFGIRVRLYDRDHMNPYYMLSYWLVAFSIIILIKNILSHKKIASSLIFLLIVFVTVTIFFQKNFPYLKNAITEPKSIPNNQTIKFIVDNANDSERILVISDQWQSSYYYYSLKKPYGLFVSYFIYTHQSEKLKTAWLNSLETYNGEFLITPLNSFSKYCQDHNSVDVTIRNSYQTLTGHYSLNSNVGDDLILKKMQNSEKPFDCNAVSGWYFPELTTSSLQ